MTYEDLDQYTQAQERIAELQAELEKHRWRLVSEGLPEDAYDVLATDRSCWHMDSYIPQLKRWKSGAKNYTHWMPIILP